jgi:transposase
MAAAVALRGDYDARRLRALAKHSDDADQTRRLLALATIYDGGSRTEAAELVGIGLQTVRDWVLRFNAEGAAGLVNRKAPGKPPLLNPAQRHELAAMIERGPIPAVDGVVRWRLIDLAGWLYASYGIATSKQTLSRIVRSMGYRKLSARPRHHAQDPEAVAAFKKVFPRAWRRSRPAMRAASR